MRWRASCVLVAAGLLALVAAPAAEARGELRDLEREFREAIESVTPATVICVPWGVDAAQASSSSGVIVTRSGYVLSDGDVGAARRKQGESMTVVFSDEVAVRVPDLETGGFAAYKARVVRRLRGELDTTLLKIEEPPAGGFPGHLPPATSEHLEVGDFVFAMGNAFGLSQEAPPTLTAGVVSALTPLSEGDAGGRIAHVYTSAAVNPGVNGGPLVDVEGRLVGTISTFMPPAPQQPHQYLGKVVPMDRIRAAHADAEGAAEVFGVEVDTRERATQTAALERVLRHAARHARPSVVSLQVDRRQPLSSHARGRGGVFPIPRFQGAVSGILVDDEGTIVTSLYQLTNVATLVDPGWAAPAEMQVEVGLRAVAGATVHLPDGTRAPAQVLAWDGRLGIVALQADLGAREGDAATDAPAPAPPIPAPAETFVEGRMVLGLGDPFGADRRPVPLLTFGILSKRHRADLLEPWRGQWQTDAGATDATCGGLVADLRGRAVGMMQIWSPPRHGRNSGIGFVVPWPAILEALPALKAGQSLGRGVLGVRFREGATQAFVTQVVEGSAADEAGIRPGDRIVAVFGRATPTVQHVAAHLRVRWAGDRVPLRVQGPDDDDPREVVAVLAARPVGDAAGGD